MSDLPTVGAEEEFLLVDPQTGEPAPRNAAVAAEAEGRGVTLQLELSSCQVETTSGIAQTSAQLGEELAELRRGAAQAAQNCGLQLLALALPPVTPRQFPVTDTERYQRIGEQFGMVAHEQGISGCHVHVEVPDRAAAIHASNWLRPWLPSLLALSANSAIYRNSDTGYASWRSVLWRRWPAAGPPPFFTSAEDYDQTVRMLIDTEVILDQKMIYWDVRPSPGIRNVADFGATCSTAPFTTSGTAPSSRPYRLRVVRLSTHHGVVLQLAARTHPDCRPVQLLQVRHGGRPLLLQETHTHPETPAYCFATAGAGATSGA